MESIWRKTCNIEKRSSFKGQKNCDVVIIGGGMAGILTAYQMQKAGMKVIALEEDRICAGQTQNTTAKITSQHGMIYHTFTKIKGKTAAWQYMQANEAAIREYEKIIKEKKINCDFEKTSAYVYSQDIQKLKIEAETASALGAAASYVNTIEIPVSCAGAVRFENQAQFHPLKFVKAIAAELEIYENTKVLTVEKNKVLTEHGVVNAKKIVFTTHYPFVNFPGMYFTRIHQERSYVLALENAGKIDGMYIGDGKESYSFRQYEKYILLGGSNHRTGKNKEGGKFENLRMAAKQFFPQSKEVTYWSAQDCISADQVPFIGKYADNRPDWLVATGFQKWGMSSSMVSALILRDMVYGISNPYAEVFASRRFSSEEIPQIIKDSGSTVKGLTKRFFYIPEETAGALLPEHGGIVEIDGEKAGVYKTKDHKIYVIDTKCPHLGCQLEWNPDERTWDCPCHGSRFDYKGNLLEGPAQKGAYYYE